MAKRRLASFEDSGLCAWMNSPRFNRLPRYFAQTCVPRSDFRADCRLAAGDVVNVVGEFDENDYVCVDMSNNNMIITNPDHLVSGSVIASSTQCIRRFGSHVLLFNDSLNSP